MHDSLTFKRKTHVSNNSKLVINLNLDFIKNQNSFGFLAKNNTNTIVDTYFQFY